MLTGEVVSDKFPYRISLFGWRLNLNRKRKKMMVILRYNFSGKRRVGGKKPHRMKYLELKSKEGFRLVW